jgi:hypothetical protein
VGVKLLNTSKKKSFTNTTDRLIEKQSFYLGSGFLFQFSDLHQQYKKYGENNHIKQQ